MNVTSDEDQQEIMDQVDDLFEYLTACRDDGIEVSNVLAAMLIVISIINENDPTGEVVH